MRLTQIRDFVAVVECGSIRAAARKLGVAQPTLTKSIRGLENELHVQLLGRSVRGIVPTPSGRAFFARARVAQSELRKAEEEAAQLHGSSAGSIAIGMGPVGVTLILPEAVERFRRQYPRARIRVVEGLSPALLPSVRDETLDFAFGLRPDTPLDRSLKFRPLYHADLVIVSRNRHPLAGARSLVALAAADWLTTVSPGSPGGPLNRAFESAGLVSPAPVLQCESYHAVMSVLAKSDMLGIMQRRLLDEPFARENLREIAVSESLPSVTAGMFMRSDAPLTRVATAMARAVSGVARKLGDS